MQILSRIFNQKTKRMTVGLMLAVTMPLVSIVTPLGTVKAYNDPVTNLERQLIPLPLDYVVNDGKFTITATTKIYVKGKNDVQTNELYKTGEYVASIFRTSTGFALPVVKGETTGTGNISISIDDSNKDLENEGYRINTTNENVSIVANELAGAFMGAQTLRQLLPASIEKDTLVSDTAWDIPVSNIKDKPEYDYRGAMLDVSRHFFTVDEVKRYIDNMSQYKINKLHMHLSDDQGWRLEIKGSMYGEEFSKLNTIGAKTSTSINGIKAGQYTQEEFKEIVAYAADRYIEIIPEFDMPGHSWAALVSLGFLNSSEDGKPHSGGYDNTKPYEGIDVGFSTFECRNEKTYEFIDEVFRQVAEISPSKYIHVGGDEAHSTSQEDYKYFMNRVTEIAKKYGKTPIGWQNYDDVVTDKEGSVTQLWSTGSAKMKDGINYLISPADHAYMDMKYDGNSEFGLQWAGYNPVDDTYKWDPTDYGPKDRIIGIEAPLWAETLGSEYALDYMTYPKIASHAEIGWTPKEKRNWDEYKQRLIAHGERLTNQGIKFYKDENIWETPYEPVNGQWNLDEGTGSVINDRNLQYPGTLVGDTTWVDGKYGKGLSFSGAGYVDLNLKDLVGDWTIGLWVKRGDNSSTNEALLSGGEGEIKLEQWKNTGRVGLTKFGVNDYTFNYSAPVNEWVHLSFVSNNDGTSLYVNGSYQDHLNVTIKAPAKRIGANAKDGLADSGNMVGSLDEVKIYNRSLTENEVFKLADRADKMELLSWLDKVKDVNEDDYTAASYQLFKEALNNANEAYLDAGKSQEEVDQVISNLQNTFNSLIKKETDVNKSLLDGMIEKAQLLEANGALDKVHETVVQFFRTALANAISVSSNPEAAQVEVDNAYQQLTYAIQLLDFKADKTLLKALIDECDAIDLSKYEAASQDEFKAALKNAKDVYDNPNALDEVSINKAIDELTKAKGNLVLKQINTGRLEYMIKLAEEALNNAGKYKQDEAWKVFVEKVNAAKEALAKLESQEAIDAATQALSEAYGNLRIKPDESIIEDLRKFLEETKDLDYGKYSLKAQKRIREAVETVERVLANEESSQNELLAANALADEARELIKHPDAKEQNKENEKETGTATGDNIQFASLFGLVMSSMAITLMVRKKD